MNTSKFTGAAFRRIAKLCCMASVARRGNPQDLADRLDPEGVAILDLPPTNRASRSLVKFVFGEEDEHEEALYGTA
ncbi:hypothetical protein, partial [Burkholderia pseudomallei]|uniref:hypothetical protein n=1 Tax=Burkholderia pseudomallei TaxID=28450 RepID=UPI0019D6DBE6